MIGTVSGDCPHSRVSAVWGGNLAVGEEGRSLVVGKHNSPRKKVFLTPNRMAVITAGMIKMLLRNGYNCFGDSPHSHSVNFLLPPWLQGPRFSIIAGHGET